MNIQIEQVDLLMQRANVGYAEAREALERCDGSIVDALVYLEKRNKVKQTRNKECGKGIVDGFTNLVHKGNHTRFILRKKDRDALNIPVNVAIVAGVLAVPVAAAGILLALFTGHRIRIEKEDGTGVQANDILDRVSSAVETAKESFSSGKPTSE